MCGQTQKQSLPAAGEVSSNGGQPAAQRARVLYHRPGGNGGGVDSLTVWGPETTLSVGTTGHGRGQSTLLVFSLNLKHHHWYMHLYIFIYIFLIKNTRNWSHYMQLSNTQIWMNAFILFQNRCSVSWRSTTSWRSLRKSNRSSGRKVGHLCGESRSLLQQTLSVVKKLCGVTRGSLIQLNAKLRNLRESEIVQRRKWKCYFLCYCIVGVLFF